jgi:Uncharacterized conserved protein (DUF2190)
MPASQNFVLAKGYDAGSAITKKRFVKFSADQTVVQCTVLGETACGVALFDVAAAEITKGKGASVLTEGRAIVEAAAAIAIGAKVTTNASGQAITAATGNNVLGICDEPASGAGAECSVHLGIGGGVA